MAKIKHCICPTKREEGAELRRYSFEIWSDHPDFCMSERVWRPEYGIERDEELSYQHTLQYRVVECLTCGREIHIRLNHPLI